jgi:hypothetical protein
MQCQSELGHPSFEPFSAPYYDERIANIRCSRGHSGVVVLQNQKFEVLLDSGANALLEGFTLEAAATFSAALERFLEFAAKVMLHHLGMKESTYSAMFSEMARQSERQIGCFLALHALVHDEPFTPNKTIAQRRNSVIHKGQIPTPEEVDEFCKAVYSEILRVLVLLRRVCQASIHAVVTADLRARTAKLPTGMQAATAVELGLLSLASAENKPTFEEALKAYAERAEVLSAAMPQMQAFHEALFPRGAA